MSTESSRLISGFKELVSARRSVSSFPPSFVNLSIIQQAFQYLSEQFNQHSIAKNVRDEVIQACKKYLTEYSVDPKQLDQCIQTIFQQVSRIRRAGESAAASSSSSSISSERGSPSRLREVSGARLPLASVSGSGSRVQERNFPSRRREEIDRPQLPFSFPPTDYRQLSRLSAASSSASSIASSQASVVSEVKNHPIYLRFRNLFTNIEGPHNFISITRDSHHISNFFDRLAMELFDPELPEELALSIINECVTFAKFQGVSGEFLLQCTDNIGKLYQIYQKFIQLFDTTFGDVKYAFSQLTERTLVISCSNNAVSNLAEACEKYAISQRRPQDQRILQAMILKSLKAKTIQCNAIYRSCIALLDKPSEDIENAFNQLLKEFATTLLSTDTILTILNACQEYIEDNKISPVLIRLMKDRLIEPLIRIAHIYEQFQLLWFGDFNSEEELNTVSIKAFEKLREELQDFSFSLEVSLSIVRNCVEYTIGKKVPREIVRKLGENLEKELVEIYDIYNSSIELWQAGEKNELPFIQHFFQRLHEKLSSGSISIDLRQKTLKACVQYILAHNTEINPDLMRRLSRGVEISILRGQFFHPLHSEADDERVSHSSEYSSAGSFPHREDFE